ncbi:zinc ribbon domain-containing protein, partial [Clostridium sp. SL.3.18]|nr:zinc ribbon domain-containing protein [Clostridium sp. SL.3.18]
VTISCTRCGYTELYKRANSEGWDIFDFLMG